MREINSEKERNLEDVMVHTTPIADLGDGKIKCLVQIGIKGGDLGKGVEITLDLNGRNKKSRPFKN